MVLFISIISFPGTCLSVRAAGSPDVTVHGPKGIMKMYEATQNFVILHEFGLLYHDHSADGAYSDSILTVKHVELKPEKEANATDLVPKFCKWLPDNDYTNKGKN